MQKSAYEKPVAKYALNRLIDDRADSLEVNRGIIIKDLAGRCGVSLSQIWRYCDIKKESVNQIPSDKMLIIATYFGVTVDSLYIK